jgi:hypothetical protein
MTLEEEVFPASGIPVPGGAHRQNRSEYRLDNGSLFIPVGIDDGLGLFSMACSFAYVAEVIEMEEQTVTDIAGCLRWIQSPEQPTLPPFSQAILDCNPGAPSHWANKRAEPVSDRLRHVTSKDDYARLQQHNQAPAKERFWKRIVTKHQDNPGYWDHDNWDYTPLGRSYITEQLEGLRGHLRERWLNGLWRAAEGSVYPMFSAERHVIKPFKIPVGWPFTVGMDPGFDHPCAILWVVVCSNGRLIIVDELYRGGLSVQQHAQDIHELNKGRTVVSYLGDPHHAFSRTAQSTRSIAEQMKDCGIRMSPWPIASNHAEEEAQVNMVRQLLEKNAGGGEPMLQVFDNCVNTIAEFQSWSHVRTPRGEIPPGDDRYEDKNDHAMDVVKGIVASKPRFRGGAGITFV